MQCHAFLRFVYLRPGNTCSDICTHGSAVRRRRIMLGISGDSTSHSAPILLKELPNSAQYRFQECTCQSTNSHFSGSWIFHLIQYCPATWHKKCKKSNDTAEHNKFADKNYTRRLYMYVMTSEAYIDVKSNIP